MAGIGVELRHDRLGVGQRRIAEEVGNDDSLVQINAVPVVNTALAVGAACAPSPVKLLG